jgi:hypothetical protein
MALLQAWYLRRNLHGIEGGKILSALIRIGLATAALMAVSFGVWDVLDHALGRSLVMQVVSLGLGLLAGIGVYTAAVWAMRLEEARQIGRLLGGRLRRSR